MAILAAHRSQSSGLLRLTLVAAQFLGLSVAFTGSAMPVNAATSAPTAPVSGTVYRDYNANGIRDTVVGLNDAVDVGVKGAKVTAYDVNNGQVGVATTDANGDYALTPGDSGAGPYRIEFILPTGFVDGPGGTNTTVQFVSGGGKADLSVIAPGDYCQSDPTIATNCYIYGYQLDPGEPFTDANNNQKYDAGEAFIDLNHNGKWDTLPDAHALVQFPLSHSERKKGKDDQLPATLTLAKDMGTTYGLAWQPHLRNLYAGAFLKRHTGFGALGTGGIYRVDTKTAPATTTPFADLNAIFGANTAGVNPHPGADLFADVASINKIGKVGLGDLDMSPDGQTLYAVNLADKTVYAIPAFPAVPDAQNTKKYPAPINTATNCTADEVRPFGLGVHIDGSVFLGAVCSAEASQKKENVRAYIWRLDPISGQWTTILDTQLTLTRPFWKAWKDIDNVGSYVQPILSDIVFDGADMILGFRDRYGDQVPEAGKRVEEAPYARSYGDTLRACAGVLPGTWDLEAKGHCGQYTTEGATLGDASPTFQYPEYYFEEYASDKGLDEASNGGLAQIPGRPFVLSTAYDPVVFDENGQWRYNRFNEFGVQRYDNKTGQAIGTYAVYQPATLAKGTFGKAGGMGDLEALCDQGPIEIGNRVWIDENGDGQQGAAEPAVAGVAVQLLYADGVPVKDAIGAPAIATTNAAGEYFFQNDPRLPSRADSSLIYIPSDASAIVPASRGLIPNTAYQIKIDVTQPALSLYSLTGANANGDSRDTADSDGELSADKTAASVTFSTAGPGINNHTYDFGFRAGVSLGNRVWFDTNNDGLDNDGDVGARSAGVPGVEVWLFQDKNGDSQLQTSERVLTTTTDVEGQYNFSGLAVGGYFVMLPEQNFKPGGPLFEYQNSTPAFDDTDSPADPNARNHGAAYGVLDRGGDGYVASKLVKLSAGTEPDASIDGTDNSGNQTIDFGFYKASLGNLVWEDSNNNGVRDASEALLPNVAVRLCSPDGNTVLQQTATNASGQYAFTNLKVGVPYVVGIIPPTTPPGTLPYQSSADVASSADPASNIDDDDNGAVLAASASTCGSIRSSVITLTAGFIGATNSTNVLSTTASTNDPTVDFGLFRPARLGNYVWFDIEETGEDGSADPDEIGVNGVTVTLLYTDGQSYVPYPFGPSSVQTNNGPDGKPGFYQFNDLIAGDYQVQFVALDNWAFTAQNSAADNEDSDPDGNGLVEGVSLASGQINDTIDAGIWVPLALGNRVFIDNNNDGLDNDGPLDIGGNRVAESSTGIDNVNVKVYYDLNGNGRIDGADRQLDNLTTQAGGYFTSFDNISGTFMMQLTPVNFQPGGPLETCASSTGNGVPVTDNNLNLDDDGEPDGSVGWTSRPVTLTPFLEPLDDGDNNPNSNNTNYSVDFGCVPLAALGNRVWLDVNNNGIQDGAENIGVAGINVALLNAATNVIVLTTTTDGFGLYTFTKVLPGDYLVHFDLPFGFVRSPANVAAAPNDGVDSDASQATGNTPQTNLVAGENDPTWDAGLTPIAGLGNRVWEDLDHNGLQDAGEPGIPNITMTLRVNGTTVATQFTDAGGFYWFDGLTPGTQYEVCVSAPANDQFAIADAGANAFNTFDSDANPTTGCLPIRTMAPAESYPDHDAGLWRPASLGNYAWIDSNRDGLQSPGENLLAGVTVDLYQNGIVISTTQTDVNGQYLFTGLVPGAYSLTFGLPDGYARTRESVLGNGLDLEDSDANVDTGATELTLLQSGESDLAWDAGYFPLAALGDYVWEDKNHNGIQDAGEPPVQGVIVTLLDKDGLEVVTQTTSAQGLYLFEKLQPSEYTLIFALPTGYAFTKLSDGSQRDVNSNVDVLTGQTERIIFLPGQTRLDVDAGVWQPASLGNFVWEDLNYNGQQDAGEPAVNDVHTMLLDGNGQTLAEQNSATQLNGSGAYTFADLIPGSYAVLFTAPTGFLFTKPTLGTDSTNSDAIPATELESSAGTRIYTLNAGDSNPTVDAGLVRCASLGNRVWLDANLNGQQDGNETGAVPVVTLKLFNADTQALVTRFTTDATGNYDFPCVLPGRYYISSAAPDDHEWTVQTVGGNDLIDSDIDRATGRTPVITLDAGERNGNVDLGLILQADLGNLVWEDRNFNGQQDLNEPVVPGVTVTLYANGSPIGVQVTNQNGKYGFSSLRPRVAYTLSFALPSGYVWTKQQSPGITSEADSNVKRDENTTFPIVLEPGDKNLTIDAGIFLPAALGDTVWEDANGNGLQDGPSTGSGELGVNDVVVTLLDTMGNAIDSQRTTTFLGKDGYYSFTNVISGTYVVSFSVPSELPYFFTIPNAGNDDRNSDAVAITRTARTAVTKPYIVNAGDDIPTVDAGVVQPASLGNRVWLDANSNGIQDADEKTPIPNTIVSLYAAVTGAFVISTSVDISGSYAITGLLPGGYCVRFAWPAGYATTLVNEGSDDALDSDVSPNTGCALTVLAPGEDDPTIDGGANVEARLGDMVWFDLDRDGVQDANAAERGIGGVSVTLRYGNRIVTSTVTNASGYYTFPNLLPLVPYTVQFARPIDTAWTRQDAGKGLDLIDSDVSIDGETRPVFLQPNEANPSVDAGMQSTLRLDEYPTTSGANGLVGADKCVTYTLVVTNTSLAAVNNVVVTDVIPADTTFSHGNVTLLPGSTNTVVWTVGTLQAGQRASNYFVVCSVIADIAALDNIAVLQGGALPGVVDANGSEVLYNPTAVTLAQFEVSAAKDNSSAISVVWTTSLEQNTYGFTLWRSGTDNRVDAVQVTSELIVAHGRNGGASYEFVDRSAQSGVIYRYWLAETELSGAINEYGPALLAQAKSERVVPWQAAAVAAPGGQLIQPDTAKSADTLISQMLKDKPALSVLFDGPMMAVQQALVKVEQPIQPQPSMDENRLSDAPVADNIVVNADTIASPKIQDAAQTAKVPTIAGDAKKSVTESEFQTQTSTLAIAAADDTIPNIHPALQAASNTRFAEIQPSRPQAAQHEMAVWWLVLLIATGVATLGGAMIAISVLLRRQ